MNLFSSFIFSISEKHQNTFYRIFSESGTVWTLTNTAKNMGSPLLVIASDAQHAEAIEQACRFFAPELPCAIFPDWETLPYDHFSPHQEIISERLKLLYELPHWQQGIIVIALNTLLVRLAPKSYLMQKVFLIKPCQKFLWKKLQEDLQIAGYHAVNQVMLPGEYAIRGSICDIYPTGQKQAFRLDFFDNEIDTIRGFDPETQRSTEKINELKILPAHEFPLDEEGIKTFRENFRQNFSINLADCSLYNAVSNGESPPGIEYYLPLFFKETASVFDYLPQKTVIFTPANLSILIERQWQYLNERYEQYAHDRRHPILFPKQVFLSVEEINAHLKDFLVVDCLRRRIKRV
mgnify:CR=1 FL=1